MLYLFGAVLSCIQCASLKLLMSPALACLSFSLKAAEASAAGNERKVDAATGQQPSEHNVATGERGALLFIVCLQLCCACIFLRIFLFFGRLHVNMYMNARVYVHMNMLS